MALEGFAKEKNRVRQELIVKRVLEKGVTIVGSGAKLELAIKVTI